MMMSRFLLLSAFIFLIAPPCASIASPPEPANKAETLSTLKKRLKEQEQEKSDLQKQIEKIEDTLSSTQDRLIETTAIIRKQSERMVTIEQRIASLELKKSVLEDKLRADRRSISRLILALQRLQRTPPEALLARPQSPYETAQTAMLIEDVIPSVTRHAQRLNSNLETLNEVTDDLEDEHQKAENLVIILKAEETEMEDLLKERKELYAKVNQDLKARELSIQKISLQAKDLKDLLKKLDEDRRREETRNKAHKALTLNKNTHSIIPNDKSAAELPVSGIIATTYNQRDKFGSASKGLSIETRSGALVTAPMSGKVQFTGTFKRYGNLIIIEHKDGYHSLLSGLGTINAEIGQIIHKGEPVGKMPVSSFIDRPKLYYELRHNSKPVDPAIKFADLG